MKTGLTRYRIGFRGVLILQVQEKYLDATDYNGHIETERRTRWRDARIEDLTEAERPLVDASDDGQPYF